jgi:hypothetical protein
VSLIVKSLSMKLFFQVSRRPRSFIPRLKLKLMQLRHISAATAFLLLLTTQEWVLINAIESTLGS